MNLDPMFAEALSCHQAGRLLDAEALYKTVLASEPGHADALHNMGVLQMQCSNPAAAVPWFRAALDVRPESPQCWLSLGEALLGAGRADEARQLIMLGRDAGLDGAEVDALEARVLPVWMSKPDLAELNLLAESGQDDAVVKDALRQVALFGESIGLTTALATALVRLGRDQEALQWLQKWCDAAPNVVDAWLTLGEALQRLGRTEEAYRAYLQALARDPGDPCILSSMGASLRDAGYLGEAWVWLSLSAMVARSTWEHWDPLWRFLERFGLGEGARHAFAKAHEREEPPRGEDAGRLLALLQESLVERPVTRRQRVATVSSSRERNSVMEIWANGRLDELGTQARRLCEQHPLDGFGWKVLGAVLKTTDRSFEQALTAMRLSVASSPDDVEAHTNLATLFNEMGLYGEAEWTARAAIELKPQSALAYSLLGMALQHQSRSVEAREVLQKALEIDPELHDVRASLAFALHFSESSTPEIILARAREYGRRVQVPGAQYSSWKCEATPKKLRIGFVSGDLRRHPVGIFTVGLFEHLDPERFELYAYVTNPVADQMTERIRQRFAVWREVNLLKDSRLAQLIHDDGVHVLIDLSGYTAYNRLPAFAYKPAPVQATWLGYFATTGLTQMDYVIGDPWLAPAGEEWQFVEKVWRLPDVSACMGRIEANGELVSPGDTQPFVKNGYVTFGSFNKLAKLNDEVLKVWARILISLPQARLMLSAKELSHDKNKTGVLSKFALEGVWGDRLILTDWNRSRADHLKMYEEVDIALDPFPYAGGTTSFEAVGLGVPVLTMKGDRFVSHWGESINHNAGLDDWIASDADDYVRLAVRLASDTEGLVKIRTRLRERILGTPLFDIERFAKNFDEALWGMWQARN